MLILFSTQLLIVAVTILLSHVPTFACDWNAGVFTTERGQFPEFDVPAHSDVFDSLSCDVAVCIDLMGKVHESYVFRSSGNRAVDLTATRHAQEITFPTATNSGQGPRIALFRLEVAPEYQSSTLTGWVNERVSQITDTQILIAALDRVSVLKLLTSTSPESAEEFRPVDFPTRLRQQLSILVPPKQHTDMPVWIQALVDTTAQFLEMRVSKSSGNGLNDSLALLGCLSVGFEPAVAGGHHVDCWATFKVDFELDTSATADETVVLAGEKRKQPDFDKFSLASLRAYADSVPPDSEYFKEFGITLHTWRVEKGDSQFAWFTSLVDHRGKIRESRTDSSRVERRLRKLVDKVLLDRTFQPSLRGGEAIPAWRKVLFSIVWNDDEPVKSKLYMESALLDNSIWERASREPFCASHMIATECANIEDFGEGPDLSSLKTDSSILLVIELCVDSAGVVQGSRQLQSSGREVDRVVENYLRGLQVKPALAGDIPVSSKLVVGAQLTADVARPLFDKSGKREFHFRSQVLEVMRFEERYSSSTACIPYGMETMIDAELIVRPDLVAQGAGSPSSEQTNVSSPVLTYWEQPLISASQLNKGKLSLTSTVWMLALIDTSGAVTDVRVEKTSSRSSYDSLAVEMGWKNKYTPALKDGKPVKVWLRYDVIFDPSYGRIVSTRLGQSHTWR